VPRKYRVLLTETQRQELRELLTAGKAPARVLTHARLWLHAAEGAGGPSWANRALLDAFDVSEPLIIRGRRRFARSVLFAGAVLSSGGSPPALCVAYRPAGDGETVSWENRLRSSHSCYSHQK